jgi:nucleoside diphosphate kinase
MIMPVEKSVVFVFNRVSSDVPKIKTLLKEKGFILRPKFIKETRLSRLDLEKIFEKPLEQFSLTLASVLTRYPTKVFLLEKENAIQDLIGFVGPNDTTKAPIGTLSKLFGEYSVICPTSDKQAAKLINLFYPEVSI